MIRIFIIFILFIQNASADEVYGNPKIIDGDTVHINSYKIRLEGIDSPEIKQKCKKDFFTISFIISYKFYKKYDCGLVSKIKLKKKISNKKIKCKFDSIDRYKRYLATCYLDKINLNKWMVRNGYAIAYKKYSKKYVQDENFAKKQRLGLWRGPFIEPEKWRKLR